MPKPLLYHTCCEISTRGCTPVGFAFKFAPTYYHTGEGAGRFGENATSVQKISAPILLSTSSIHQLPSLATCPTHSEAEKRIERALDEMRALESVPVITDFARQYDVPLQPTLQKVPPPKSDRVSGNRRFSDVEEKAICRYI